MSERATSGTVSNRLQSPWWLSLWTVSAAFGTYFCMYAFRKPFTAAQFPAGVVFGLEEKTVLVISQVLGYMVSKFLGIRVIAEMRAERRAVAILALIGGAQAALALFAVVPPPFHVLCMFFNGLPLGMVFGLVLGYLEGRRQTEALAAGLCASFILADGFTKSVGRWLIDLGVSERAMPFAAGCLFLLPLLTFVWMLSRIPPPRADDVAHRSAREPMSRADRRAFVRRYGFALVPLIIMYLFVTILRSVRADFAPELWRELGVVAVPATFTRSEAYVALGILAANGLSILIGDNRRAFFASLGVSLFGLGLILFALSGLRQESLGGFAFMVLLGLGLYLPYVAMHTTIFERLIALTRDRGNIGFLLYLADAVGYLGYVVVMVSKSWFRIEHGILPLFTTAGWWCTVISAFLVVLSGWWMAKTHGRRGIRPSPLTGARNDEGRSTND